MATQVIKRFPSDAYRMDFNGKEGPYAGLEVRSGVIQKSIATTASGVYNFSFSLPDTIGLDAKVWKIGCFAFKDQATPTEDWLDGTGAVKWSAIKLEKATVVDQTSTLITSKGRYYSGAAFTSIFSISSLAADIGTAIDNADEIAYWEADRESDSALFSDSTNKFSQGDFLRLAVTILNSTGGTVVPFVQAFIQFDRSKV